jgi:hypothetical protein
MHIRIFSIDPLELLAEIDNYESLVFNPLFYEKGTFEITISSNKKNVEYLVEDNIIILENQFAKCGVIQEVRRTAELEETLVVSGYTMDYIFGFRIAHPGTGDYDSITNTAETCIKHYLANNVTAPTDTNRTIALFNLAADLGRGDVETFNARFETLDEFLDDIRVKAGMGIRCTFDPNTGQFEVDVLPGVDRRSGTANPVLFSMNYGNLEREEYYRSKARYRSHAYVLGDGAGSTRTVVEVGTETGVARREMTVDTKLPALDLPAAGANELAQVPILETYEGKIIDTGPFIYGVDYDLGDIVTIVNKKWTVELATRIIGIMEIYEPGNTSVELQFGNKIPELKDVINRKTKKEVL